MKYLILLLILSISACKTFDYHINIDDNGTMLYNKKGKFVDFIPFDSTSRWDKALIKDNL